MGLERNEAGGGGTRGQGEEGKWYKSGEVSGWILGRVAGDSKGNLFFRYVAAGSEDVGVRGVGGEGTHLGIYGEDVWQTQSSCGDYVVVYSTRT